MNRFVPVAYRSYDVLAKWDTVSFDDRTRDVVRRRLHEVPSRRFLSGEEWTLVEALVEQLMPQRDRSRPIPITPWIDDMLHANRGEGYRHEGSPSLRETWRAGLAAIDAESLHRHGRRFTDLDENGRNALLQSIQREDVDTDGWRAIAPKKFFIDILLKTVAGIYYSHPSAWSEIGFGGPASPRGYVRLGFDRVDPWEAQEER
jgi:hypothetical protein